MDAVCIAIPQALVPYASPALARLGYLYPDVEWVLDAPGNAMEIRFAAEAHEIATLRKELFFQLYREKIHHDTLAVRSRLYDRGG